MMSKSQTRRTALASLATLAAAPAGAMAAKPPADPILAAIERHREAFAAFEAAPSWGGDCCAEGEANREAAEALASAVPTTMQGTVALLDYLRDFERLMPLIDWHDGLPDGFEAAVRESIDDC
jgi:hypothetical protein